MSSLTTIQPVIDEPPIEVPTSENMCTFAKETEEYTYCVCQCEDCLIYWTDPDNMLSWELSGDSHYADYVSLYDYNRDRT